MNNMHDFSNLKNRAIDELWKMNEQAVKIGHFNGSANQEAKRITQSSSSENAGLSFSNDELLILGIVLILLKDSHDYWLFLALLYILM